MIQNFPHLSCSCSQHQGHPALKVCKPNDATASAFPCQELSRAANPAAATPRAESPQEIKTMSGQRIAQTKGMSAATRKNNGSHRKVPCD